MLSPPIRLFCLLTLEMCLAAACLGATDSAPVEYTSREWHDSDGLPSEEIDSLALDDFGYLWIASPGKFARFDGTTFEVSKIPPEITLRGMTPWHDPAQKSSSGLVAQVSTSAGADRISAIDAAGYFSYVDGTFLFKPEPELSGKTVKTTFCETNGTLWLGCEDGTLFRRQGKDTRLFPAPPGANGKKAPAFTTDQKEQVWILVNEAVSRFDGAQWTPVPIQVYATEIRLVSSRTGGPWLVTHNAVYKWNDEKFEEIAPLDASIGAHFVKTAIEDRHGDLWLGTRSQGLHRIVGHQAVRIPVSHEDISALREDSDGNIWVGTNGGGLVRLKTKTFWLYDKSSGLTDDFSNSVTEDRHGIIWLANRDGGVARIQNGVVDPLSKRANWRTFSAKSVFPAADGGVLITTGIGVYRTKTDNHEQVERVPGLANVRLVRVTFVARNGDYWLAVDPDKLLRWRDGQVTTFGPAEGFDGSEVRAITEDSAGVIWIGADDGKLYRSRENRFERVPLPSGETYGLLQALWFEPDGTLLIGTTRKGILILPRGAASNPRQLTTKQGLPNGDVTNILQDDSDRYWFASRGGIFSIQGTQLREFVSGKINRVHAVLIGKDDGLPQLSGLGRTQPSAWKAHDGELWFATRKGVVRVNPTLTSDFTGPAPATIAQIKCDGLPQPVAEALKIKSTVRKTEIRFSVLCLSFPEQTVIRYRLDGFDNDWVLQGKRGVATYPRLAPGTYVLHVEVSSGAETWNEQPPLLTILVVSPWWQSELAQLAYLLMLVLCVAVFVRFWTYRRFRMRLEHSEREQALERERTRIARNIHDDLGASLTRISLITQSAQHKNPTLAPEFEQIFETVRTSTRSLDEIVWAVNPKCDDVENLVSYLGNYAQKFLGAAGIRRQLDLPPSLPAIKLSSQARHNLFLCCKEALNNVVKHADAKEVTLSITLHDSLLRIEISDDGRGFAAAKAGAPVDPQRIAGGNGQQNMRDRIEEMGGTLTVSERPQGGTIVAFALKLPLPPKFESRSAETSPPIIPQ